MRFRLVFFGTPEFAAPTLRALLAGPDHVAGVVCQPDRPAGRGQRVHAPPVKEVARAAGVPIAQPEKLRSGDFPATLAAWAPDLAVVVAYGRILPPAILTLPPRGCVNVHASLLPRWRGAAPIQRAVLRGDAQTGVTTMQMNERMDEGDILLQWAVTIGPDETAGELHDRLAALGADLLMATLAGLAAGTLRARPQDGSAVTLAPPIEKAEARIDWARPVEEISRLVRAFNPWPSAFTTLDGRLLKIHRAHARVSAPSAPPGTVIAVGATIDVAAGAGVLAVEELQLEGRRRLRARDFVPGTQVGAGTRLGTDG